MKNVLDNLRYFFTDTLIGIILVVFVGFGVPIGIVANVAVAKWCRSQAAVLQVEDVDYHFWSGCNYKVDGVWIDSDQYGLVILGGRP